jgi:hypothetical protein
VLCDEIASKGALGPAAIAVALDRDALVAELAQVFADARASSGTISTE